MLVIIGDCCQLKKNTKKFEKSLEVSKVFVIFVNVKSSLIK